jgi:hypothetical protein
LDIIMGMTKVQKEKFKKRSTDQLISRLIDGGVSEGIAKTVAETVVKAETARLADIKKGVVKGGRGRHDGHEKTEDVSHGEAAAFMMGLADPYAVIKDVGVASGIHPGVMHALAERMRSKYLPVLEVTKEYTNAYYVNRINEKMDMCLDHMDEYAFATASLRDIATAFGILGEHRRLFNDEPTVILGVQERKHLNDLLPMVYEEAKRRGVTIDATAEDVRAIPEDTRKALDSTFRRAEAGLTQTTKNMRVGKPDAVGKA